MRWTCSASASDLRSRKANACFAAAVSLGLPVKIHAEQLSNCGATQLAARHRALSADHLEYLDEAGAVALSEAGTVAVLLPGAFYFLRETKLPPLDLLRRYDVPIALATDANPGSSPTTSLLLMLNLACTLFRMTVAEALAGVMQHAARALGQAHRHGVLAAGRDADFVLWDIQSPAELAYWFGRNPCRSVVRGGRFVRGATTGERAVRRARAAAAWLDAQRPAGWDSQPVL